MIKKANLSVCIITRNEEKMLHGCLESISQIANEIIVVDTGSDDATIEIAKSFQCRIFNFPWNDDFSEARNIALSQARYPYVLSIDADERLANPEAVPELLMNSNFSVGGWLVRVISEARRNDGGIDIYVSNLLRLFRSHPEIRFRGIIHEQVLESVLKLGFTLENSALHFTHLGYSHSSEEMHKKQKRNLDLLNKSIISNPNEAHDIYQRAKTYLALGDLKRAENDIQKALEIVNETSVIKPQSLNFGAVIAYQQGNIDLAIERASSSLQLVNGQSFANFLLGECYSAKQNFGAAYEAYVRMQVAQGNQDVIAGIVGDYYLPQEQLSYRLGRSLVGIGLYDDARKHFDHGIEQNPKEISCYVGLANVFFKNSDYFTARNYLEKALEIEPNRDDLKNFFNQVQTVINAQNTEEPITLEAFVGQTIEKLNTQECENLGLNKEKCPQKPLITLAMIVKNEEEMLAGCLESVRGIVDEIVIVDTGSTDSTKDIANKYNAKVFDFVWCNDFSAARNEALSHSTGEWILYLDADERLNAPFPEKLRQLLANSPDDIGGFICTIESNHIQLDGAVEHHRGGYPRIFRNYGYPNISFQGRVHEQITPSLFALKKGVLLSDIIIEHLGYNQSREVMEQKVRRNYAMLMEHIREEPLNSYAWYQLGQTLAQMTLFDEAENAIRFAIECGKLSDSVYASATATLAQLVGNKRQFDESLHWSERSLEKAPNQVYALNLKAYSLLYLNKASEAEQAFLEVLRRLRSKKTVPQSGFDIDIPEDVPLKGLQEARMSLGLNKN